MDLRVIGKGYFIEQGGLIKLFLVREYTQVYLKLLVLAFRLTIYLRVEYDTKLTQNAEVVAYSALVLAYKYATPIRDDIIQKPYLRKDPKQELYKSRSINYFIYQLRKTVYKDKDGVILYAIRSYRLREIYNKVK